MATIKHFNKRLASLKMEYDNFKSYFCELADYHLRHRNRFQMSDRNKTPKRNTRQTNNTSRLAARTLASGMMAGITSPSRPWFRLAIDNSDLMELHNSKMWLKEVQDEMYRIYSGSNFYQSVHMLYGDCGVFGTSPMIILSDDDNVITTKTYPVGSYYLGAGATGEIDSFYREYELSVGQVVKEYGYDNCSNETKNAWDQGNTEVAVKLIHAVEPNDNRDRQSPLAKHKAFRSVHYEASSKEKFLRESGFDDFPFVVLRWETIAEDIFASDCPGMVTLGDTKALQVGERCKYNLMDKMCKPKYTAPASLQGRIDTNTDGDIIYTATAEEKIAPIYVPDPNAIIVIKDENRETEQRIRRGFYEDLFLMLMNTDRRQITAREIAERHEEKLLMLGPVLERIHTQLDHCNKLVFNIAMRKGRIPPPPPELQGQEINIEYVSILAQAQRIVATDAIEKVAAYAGGLAAVWPEARHKFNAEQSIDEFSDAIGIPPDIIRSDEEVAARVQAEQQAAQQAAMQEQLNQMAQTAKTAGDITTDENSLAGQYMRQAGMI